MSALLDIGRVATHVPSLDSAVLFSTDDGLPIGQWSRVPGPAVEVAAAHWSALLHAAERTFTSTGAGAPPSRLVLHAPARTVALSTLDARRGLALVFATRMSADWSEHYLRRATTEAQRLLGIDEVR